MYTEMCDGFSVYSFRTVKTKGNFWMPFSDFSTSGNLGFLVSDCTHCISQIRNSSLYHMSFDFLQALLRNWNMDISKEDQEYFSVRGMKRVFYM